MRKVIPVVLTFLLLLPFCGRAKKESDEVKVGEVKFKVHAAPVKKVLVTKSLSYPGIVEAYRVENITPKITGKIKRIYVEEGDKVSKGQLLVELDTEQAEIQLKQALGALEAAKASFEDAKKNYERGKKLLAEEAISKQQFEKLELAYKAAKGQLEQAKAAVELARFLINSSRLYAPFSGVITSKLKNEGDFVNPAMGGFSSGSGIVVLMNFEKVKVYVDVPSSKIDLIKKGQSAVIKWKDYIIRGKVFSLSQAADPASKTFKVGVLADNENLVLKPGMDVEVKIIYFEKEAIAVPRSALLEGGYVFVVDKGVVHRRKVDLGIEGDELVEVLHGLRPGELIVVSNLFGLYDGAKVEVVK